MAGIFGKALNPGDDFLEQSKFDGVSVNVPPSHRRVGAFAFRHPLEESEAQWQQNEEAVRLKVLRSTQGIQAPLRIKMELKAAEKVYKATNCRIPTVGAGEEIVLANRLFVQLMERREGMLMSEGLY